MFRIRTYCLLFFARQALLTTDVLQGVPFLVLGNKIDLPQAASENQLRDALGLHDTTGKEVRRAVPLVTQTVRSSHLSTVWTREGLGARREPAAR